MITKLELQNFYQNRKVLVTGHTGFKGSWLCVLLKELGADLYGFSLAPPTDPNLFSLIHMSDCMNSFIGDIRDLNKLKQVFEQVQPEIVIHMAAQPIVRESYRNPVETYEVNVIGTANVLECIRLSESVRSAINVTTDKVYRNMEWARGYVETDYLDGYDPYSNSKSCSELVTHSYIQSFMNDKNIAISTCRAGNVIGGGDFAPDRIIPDCVRAAADNKEIVVRNPHSIRPYQHVLEPLTVYLLIAMEQYCNYDKAGSYNVGPEDIDCVTTGDLVTLFCEKWNRELEYEHLHWTDQSDGGPHEANLLKLDCTKLKNIFQWQPRWNIDMALEKVVEFETLRAVYNRQMLEEDMSITLLQCMRNQIALYLQ